MPEKIARMMQPTMKLRWYHKEVILNGVEIRGPGTPTIVTTQNKLQQLWKDKLSDYEEWIDVPFVEG